MHTSKDLDESEKNTAAAKAMIARLEVEIEGLKVSLASSRAARSRAAADGATHKAQLLRVRGAVAPLEAMGVSLGHGTVADKVEALAAMYAGALGVRVG